MAETATGPDFTINTPPVTGVHNVRDYGATGDGVTDDGPAVQQAFDAAQSGESVYFPSGSYRLASTINVQISNLRTYGDGDVSTIRRDTTQGHIFYVRKAGIELTSMRFEHLRFVGAGVFDKNINGGVALYLESAPGAQVTDCTFEGCGMATSDDGSTSGTTLPGLPYPRLGPQRRLHQ